MKHTPTKWRIDENRDDFGDLILFAENHDFKPMETPRDIRIASVVHDEDAEHIVKCVNSHDELLEAAKALFGAMKLTYVGSFPGGPIKAGILQVSPELYLKLEKAIQKADGK